MSTLGSRPVSMGLNQHKLERVFIIMKEQRGSGMSLELFLDNNGAEQEDISGFDTQ